MTDGTKLPIILKTEERLKPEYLNSFRNSAHYQKALTEGVQAEGKIVPVTLTDILTASNIMMHVFTGSVEHKGAQYPIIFEDLYINPAMRIIGAEDRIKLARTVDPKAFGEAIYNPESVIGFIAAVEKLTSLERAMTKTKNPEKKAEREYLIGRLTEFIKDKDGMNALVLWTMEGGKPIKSAKTSREAFENMVVYLTERLSDENKRNNELTKKLFDGGK